MALLRERLSFLKNMPTTWVMSHVILGIQDGESWVNSFGRSSEELISLHDLFQNSKDTPAGPSVTYLESLFVTSV